MLDDTFYFGTEKQGWVGGSGKGSGMPSLRPWAPHRRDGTRSSLRLPPACQSASVSLQLTWPFVSSSVLIPTFLQLYHCSEVRLFCAVLE